MGRWSYHTYSCKNFCRLTIASVHQPCNQLVTERRCVQTLTITAQHTSILRQQGRNETSWQAFITDLRQFITDQHSQGNGVCSNTHHRCAKIKLWRKAVCSLSLTCAQTTMNNTTNNRAALITAPSTTTLI